MKAATMPIHDLSEADARTRLTAVAHQALRQYRVAEDSTVALLDLSENATFRVDDAATGEPTVLRVHRLDYHSPKAIASELRWLAALREEAGVSTPRVIPTRDGAPIVTVAPKSGGPPRQCVMFEFLPGAEPPAQATNFENLGEITARMHRHALSWTPPAGFTRFQWDHDAAYGPRPRWGSWRDGVGVGPSERAILQRLEDSLRRRLAAYTTPERWGLIHADLRLANLLVDDAGAVRVIDFDDCGYSWYLYDLGTAVSFFEHEPQVPELVDSWVRGYRKVRELPRADEDEIWTFILFRRLLLLAWIGSHSGVELARQLGANYTQGSCELAERYLSQYG